MTPKLFLLASLLLCNSVAFALTEAFVPAWRCDSNRALASGFEDNDGIPPERGSGGSGGASGDTTITVPFFPSNVTYYLDYPFGYSNEVLPLIIALHGAGGQGTQPAAASGLRFAFSNLLATGERFIVVAPEGSGSQGGGWVLGIDAGKIQAVLDDVATRFNVDRNRVYGWGFSAGGQMMHFAALTSPPLVAAYTAHAGLLPANGSASGTPETATRKVPALMTHGTSDSIVPISFAQSDRLRFLNSGWLERSGTSALSGNYQLITFNMDHTYDLAVLRTSWRWMCERALLP
jgi:poly(3-hydroxybutyrate) depolymerase